MARPRFPGPDRLRGRADGGSRDRRFGNVLRGEPVTWLMAANWSYAGAADPTWGYALQRSISCGTYWRRVSWILLVATALTLARVAAASTTALVLVLAFMAGLLPAYIAAFRYGFARLISGLRTPRNRSPGVARTVPPAIQAGLCYSALTFGTAFLLGPPRILVLVPRIGARAAQLADFG